METITDPKDIKIILEQKNHNNINPEEVESLILIRGTLICINMKSKKL